MILGIDASNIRAGGGLTHISELLGSATPNRFGFERVVVWAASASLKQLPERAWLVKQSHPWLERSLPWRVAWQRMILATEVRRYKCDITFVPGGSASGRLGPVVSMSQNLLPFDWAEIRRFGMSLFAAKLLLLRWSQSHALKKSNGVVFLTAAAMAAVCDALKWTPTRYTIVPHGIDARFRLPPRAQKYISEYTMGNPLRLLYVSYVWPYKHPWTVVEAVAKLRNEGLPVSLDIIGDGYGPSLCRLKETIDRFDPKSEFIRHKTSVAHGEISSCYQQADLFIFASSCETFGQIVTEAMSAGLPIVCSNRAAMPELLQGAGAYFDPENPEELAKVLKDVVSSPELRSEMAYKAYRLSESFSWEKCADETFAFIKEVAEAESR